MRVPLSAHALWLALATGCQTPSTVESGSIEGKALEIYRTAIGYRSAEGHGQVRALADYLAEEFKAGGFPSEDVHVLPYMLESGEEIASLVVRYRGDGSSGEKPILILAHMDVVDALPQYWERDPFTLVEEAGYFYGRGSVDNKADLAMVTATFLQLRAEGIVPTRDLILAFTGDEETRQLTIRNLLDSHRELIDAEYVLNADAGFGILDVHGDPAVFELQTSEKTYATFELTITNPGGHSSRPRSDNAIYELARVLEKIEAYRFPVRSNETTREYLRFMADRTEGAVGDAMRRFAEDPDDADAAEVLFHEPSYVGTTRTTWVATMIRAGDAENSLPKFATVTLNCRIFPGVEIAEVHAKLSELAQEAADHESIEIELLEGSASSPSSTIRPDVFAAVRAAVDARFPGTQVLPYMSSYGTEGAVTRAAEMPTYGVSGLFVDPDDIRAHGLDERIPVESFYGGLDHWYVLLTTLAGPPR